MYVCVFARYGDNLLGSNTEVLRKIDHSSVRKSNHNKPVN